MLFLKAIQLNFANTTAEQYITAQQVDVSNIPDNQSFGWLRVNASTQPPYFDDHGDWFEVFPRFTSSHNLTQAIRIIYYLQPTLYAAVGDTMSYPEDLDQAILGSRIAANYKRSLGDFEAALAFDTDYEKKVRDYVATLSRGVQQPIRATPLQVSGWEF